MLQYGVRDHFSRWRVARADGGGAEDGENAVARSKSSGRWLREHHSDPYVQRSRAEGYRSRASYKLLELQRSDRLLRPGDVVVDLGAAPGGWTQVAVDVVGARGLVLASDILPMDPIPGVSFVQGDFTEDAVFERVLEVLGERRADLVMSDMAPNMSGIRDVDQPRSMLLAELALDLAGKVLKPGGKFVCKVFHGEGFDAFLKSLRAAFTSVLTRKPDASRGRSREVYVIASGFRAQVRPVAEQ
ncbi:MAG: Ribosomal RNA large subunit methyltransferase E [Pseudomonadales bacterium]|nr:Ribosomal RNA large subunit methyltransferase E [Pseudomonadales bacterium]